jgi:sec-independent protein translocase protein TatA
MSFGPLEIALIILAVLLLFGYKKLPDASRSLGRSLRIFKGEMKGMKDDDSAGGELRTRDAARTTPVSGEIVPPPPAAPSRDADLTSRLQAEASEAELRAAEARERAQRARSADPGR